MSTIGLTTYMREFPLPINNQQKAYLLANSTGTPPVGASLNDLWVRYLRQKGFTGTLPEMQKKWAESIIGYETFSISDALGALDGVFPNDLFRAGEQGVWYDPADMSTLFQDSTGTIPVTATGQPVGLILDKSGNGFHALQTTAGSRPTFQDVGGLRYLQFDGVDDFLVTSAINFTGTDKVSVFAGARKTASATAILVELSASIATNTGAFYITAPGGANAYNTRIKGNTAPEYGFATPSIVPPDSAVLTTIGDLAQPVLANAVIFRRNGSSAGNVGVNTPVGVGPFGNHPLFIGRRGGTTLPFTGHLYGLVVRGALTDATTTTTIEDWMALRTGIVLP